MRKHHLVYTALPLLAFVSVTGPALAMEGRAWGDIHVQTLDGATYDFQAAGEYVTRASPKPPWPFTRETTPTGTPTWKGAPGS